MSLFDLFKRNRSRKGKLASDYTNLHSTGGLFEMRGREANLWEATNPRGDIEYFVIDRAICWNAMCMYGRRGHFSPDPDDFVFKEVDLSIVPGFGKDVKEAWVYSTLVSSSRKVANPDSMIPNINSKVEALKEEYSKGWYLDYSTVRKYVESLGRGGYENDFFKWLFDDSRFEKCLERDIPHDYQQAYHRFLDCLGK